uniref:Uncharacterized protein n=1 Tax=uncultured prokaryote TaxID=198431 RepID=A0A0H5Q5Q3_9ZZZZ|nr:hypothetical protein [uncultured prokaryote]
MKRTQSKPTSLRMLGYEIRSGQVVAHVQIVAWDVRGREVKMGLPMRMAIPSTMWLDDDICAFANDLWQDQKRRLEDDAEAIWEQMQDPLF